MGNSTAFVTMEGNECIGTVVVQPFWGALHVKCMWVNEVYKKKKIGTLLMERAFGYGIDLHFPFAFIETMSFPALD